jgi:MoaA/NifB/PqqE/SkfB family radical SAM enzyme
VANLSVTTVCNRDCEYCFAAATNAGQGRPARHVELSEFDRALDFLERSGIEQARLLGGEPTLHPQFPELVSRALQREFRLVVFSNGLMPDAALSCLKEAPESRVAVLLNATGHTEEPAEVRRLRERAMEGLGRRVTLGLNISAPSCQPGFLLDLVRQYGLSPCIRVGLAHPCVAGENRYLHPRYYRVVGQRIADFAEAAGARGVRIALDCGFVPCMFPAGVWGALGAGTGCGPMPDLVADGRVVPCYPLAPVCTETLLSDDDAAHLRGRFTARLAAWRALGVFRECARCEWRDRGDCSGGCLAAAMLRLR